MFWGFFSVQDRDMSHRQSPCGDSVVGVGDAGKEAEGCVDQLMGLGDSETAYNSSAFEQWDSYWEDLTRYQLLYLCAFALHHFENSHKTQNYSEKFNQT